VPNKEAKEIQLKVNALKTKINKIDDDWDELSKQRNEVQVQMEKLRADWLVVTGILEEIPWTLDDFNEDKVSLWWDYAPCVEDEEKLWKQLLAVVGTDEVGASDTCVLLQLDPRVELHVGYPTVTLYVHQDAVPALQKYGIKADTHKLDDALIVIESEVEKLRDLQGVLH
jgi:hypothetical protein